MLKYFLEEQTPVTFSSYEARLKKDLTTKISFYSLIKEKYLDIECRNTNCISDSDIIYITPEGAIAYQHYKSKRISSVKQWFFSSFLGGVITGVVTTLAAEALLYLGAKIIGLL